MSAREELRAQFSQCVESASLVAAAWTEQWLTESSDEELSGWTLYAKDRGFQLQRIGNGWRWEYLVDLVEVGVYGPTIFYQRTIVKHLARDSRGDRCVFAEVDMFNPHEVLDCGADRI